MHRKRALCPQLYQTQDDSVWAGEKETVDPSIVCADFPEKQKHSQKKDTQKSNLSMVIFVLAKILFLDRQQLVILHILRFHRLIPPKVV